MHRTIHTTRTAPRCGAQTRQGTACQSPAVRGKRRCRMHGGTNAGGPRGNQHALKHGRYTAQAIAERREARQLWRMLKALLGQLG
jgi:hypothetical protein